VIGPISYCSFCSRPLKRVSGLDMVGRTYCRRWRCSFVLFLKRHTLRLAHRIERHAGNLARRLRDTAL
jgi:hypothetical protein